MEIIKNGWVFENTVGTVMAFNHVPLKKAKMLEKVREAIFVVETINFTFAEGDEKTVHHNRYFAYGLGNAISLAATLEISSKDVAEEVIGIRPVSDEEATDFLNVAKYYSTKMPQAIPIEKVRHLVKAQNKRKKCPM